MVVIRVGLSLRRVRRYVSLLFFSRYYDICKFLFRLPWTCCPLFTSQSPLTLTLANPIMEVIHSRSALLSNFEVLTLLRELDADHIARTKSAVRIKKEEDASGKPTLESHTEEVSENLRTVELEVSSPVHRTPSIPLTCNPGNSIPLRRVPAHVTTVRSWHISACPRPCSLLPHKSRETASRKPCPDRARRALCRVSPQCTPYRPFITPVR